MGDCGKRRKKGLTFQVVKMSDKNKKPVYCTRPSFIGTCNECSLSNYGRDCMNKPIFKNQKEGII